MLSAKARSAVANPIGGWIKTSHLDSFDCKAGPLHRLRGLLLPTGLQGGGL